MVWDIIASALLPSLLGGASRPQDNSSKYINEYMQKMQALKPNFEMALQDPAVQALERGGIKAGQMAQQRALNQLISQGFKRSTLTPQLSTQAGVAAKQPFLEQKTNMQSQIANRDYQQQAEGLKMLLQSRLGLAQQQAQHDTGFGLMGMMNMFNKPKTSTTTNTANTSGSGWFDWMIPGNYGQ
jgi:hypothetical protein